MKYKNLNNLTDMQYDYYKERDNLNIVLPSVAVDAIILAEKNNELYMLLQKYDSKHFGIIGSFIQTGLSFKDNIDQIVHFKTVLDISNKIKKQIKVYDSPHRDTRGHIITISYVIFTDYHEIENHSWVKVKFENNNVYLCFDDNNQICLTNDSIISQNSSNYYLKFDKPQGHGTMIYDAINYLNETLFTKGELLNVYNNGFTTTEAWQLIENFYNKKLSRTNIRRKILKISEDTHMTKLEHTSHSKIYKIK